ncbi:uncharacterized protein LOC132940183 [Metopolophium dirhodum]|uniref:uncharacterized protein LOC132940183 n=1 Tax=Metopolophium dirhodum TaxID=44670 RepID=UPI00298F43E2|nr:uncharacterized protein LOC132940183 [Metopolophium dirhodum]XP_060863623.1 uncharacterized protein LOC132940183 [Metopolophium dirhodum]XP_060863624.1 uncharacterized protein LOC132940183 [Metopolophium dirhodum]
MVHLTLVAGLVFGFVAASTAGITDDGTEGLSAVGAPWEDSRLDERIYADTPNYLTFQLNRKRYSVPYHPVARLRASQTAGVVLPYAMIANRNYMNDDGNRFEPVWKPTAAELLTVLMNRRKNADTGMDNTNFMRFGISKRTRFDDK